MKIGLSICEDIWEEAPTLQAARAGAQLLLNINGSPYHVGKARERARLLAAEARRSRVPVVYLNMVGGQDELVFDGDSMVFGADGQLLHRSPQFAVDRFVVDVPVSDGTTSTEVARRPISTTLDARALIASGIDGTDMVIRVVEPDGSRITFAPSYSGTTDSSKLNTFRASRQAIPPFAHLR